MALLDERILTQLKCASTNSWGASLSGWNIMALGQEWAAGGLQQGWWQDFFLSSNHSLVVVCSSTVQWYSVHKSRCFPSFCVGRTSRAGLWTCISSAWGCWRSYLPSCWHNNFIGRLYQVQLVFLHHFSGLWTTLFSHLSRQQGGLRHRALIGLLGGGEALVLGEV